RQVRHQLRLRLGHRHQLVREQVGALGHHPRHLQLAVRHLLHDRPLTVALPARWRLLVDPAGDGATNMAVDHALLDRAARSGEAVFRIYGWAQPTLSLGMHEKARLDPDAAAARGIAVVRRPTGGRALLHHREVTYSVTAPAHDDSLRASYAAINAILLDA